MFYTNDIMNNKRLIQEWKKYQVDKLELTLQGLIDLYPITTEDLTKWQALITPSTHLFKDTVWVLDIDIPLSYPSQPPMIRFHISDTKPIINSDEDRGKVLIYKFAPPHVNIDFHNGDICLDILKNNWTPLWSLTSCIIAIIVLINGGGDESSPLNVDMLNLVQIGDESLVRDLCNYYVNLQKRYKI